MRALLMLVGLALLPAAVSAQTLCFRIEDPGNPALGYVDVKLVVRPVCRSAPPASVPQISAVHGALQGYDQFGSETEGWLLSGTCRGDADSVLLSVGEIGGGGTLQIFGASLTTGDVDYGAFEVPVALESCGDLAP